MIRLISRSSQSSSWSSLCSDESLIGVLTFGGVVVHGGIECVAFDVLGTIVCVTFDELGTIVCVCLDGHRRIVCVGVDVDAAFRRWRFWV